MPPVQRALTEKEKETLRLLLSGHDAKSIARTLGLSVHTIHERLREARRKLGTASSREAARLLGEIERRAAAGGDPQFMGDMAIGDAVARDPAQAGRHPGEGLGGWRRAGWITGGLAMTISLALLALLAATDPGPAPGPSAPVLPDSAPVAAPPTVARTPAAEAAAVAAARQFLLLLDRDDWRACWQATHRSFQLQNTVEWWVQASRAVRGEVGRPLARELARVDFVGAPPTGYWIVTFTARYSSKGATTETLQLASEDGGWKVAGITIE